MTLHICRIIPDDLCHLEYDTNAYFDFYIYSRYSYSSSQYLNTTFFYNMIIYLSYSNMKVLLAGVKYEIENMHYFQSHTISMILHAKEIIR